MPRIFTLHKLQQDAELRSELRDTREFNVIVLSTEPHLKTRQWLIEHDIPAAQIYSGSDIHSLADQACEEWELS